MDTNLPRITKVITSSNWIRDLPSVTMTNLYIIIIPTFKVIKALPVLVGSTAPHAIPAFSWTQFILESILENPECP